jgi:hypothetical protein
MAANKYVSLILGKYKEVIAAVTSTANAILAMDATGRIDISVLPVGVGAEVVVCPSKEALTAGDWVNFVLDGGVIKAQKADGTTNTKVSHGFVLANSLIAAPATVFLPSNINTAVAGLVIGDDYYLSTVAGGVTNVPLSAAGNLSQWIGKATAVDKLPFEGSPSSAVEIA